MSSAAAIYYLDLQSHQQNETKGVWASMFGTSEVQVALVRAGDMAKLPALKKTAASRVSWNFGAVHVEIA